MPMGASRTRQPAARQQLPLLCSVPSSAPAQRPWPSALLSGRSLSSVAPVPLPRPLSGNGQALAKRFTNGGLITNEARAVEWFRATEMDNYAAELLTQHEGSLELERLAEELDARGANLSTGTVSSNGAIEHIGEGVHLGRTDQTKVATQIDPDSQENLHTITRVDQRVTARLAIATVDVPDTKRKMTVVGQAGIGKTRGGLAYTLQLLLWRGEAVIRAGYKNQKAYLFLPDAKGEYRVWETEAKLWGSSRLARDIRTYVLIDPPESGPYVDAADCHIIKWASNNAKKHYHNWSKDGHLLVAAMPTLEEVLAMVPFLWNDTVTPYPHQLAADPERFDSLKARREEIKKRCELTGTILRVVFNHEKFTTHLDGVVAATVKDGLDMEPALLLEYLRGTATTAEGEASSVSSLRFLLTSLPGDTTQKQMLVQLVPVARHILRTHFGENIKRTDPRRPFDFEDLASRLLQKGGEFDGVILPERTLVTPGPKNKQETAAAILRLLDSGDQLVVASPTFNVLDQAASQFEWYNAKTGKGTPTVKTMAFFNLMTHYLKMAKPDGKGGLALEDEYAARKKSLTSPEEKLITLTFLQSNISERQKPNDCKFVDDTKEGVERHTVISLKAELRKLGLHVGGNKAVLLDRLRAQPAGAAAVAPTPKHELVKQFFVEHVNVKTVDCSNFHYGPADPDAMQQLGEYSPWYKKLYPTNSQKS